MPVFEHSCADDREGEQQHRNFLPPVRGAKREIRYRRVQNDGNWQGHPFAKRAKYNMADWSSYTSNG